MNSIYMPMASVQIHTMSCIETCITYIYLNQNKYCLNQVNKAKFVLQQIAKIPSFQISLAWHIIAVISLPFKLVMVLAWFPITSSWNPACYIRGLIHGIGRGVPNGRKQCLPFGTPRPIP